jgi:hydrogenase expression/formation protein HypC
MCLAIPVQVLKLLHQQLVEVVIGGTRCKVSCALIDPVEVGDYIIVHAGFAIAKLDIKEAEITLGLFDQIAAHLQESNRALSPGIS